MKLIKELGIAFIGIGGAGLIYLFLFGIPDALK